MAVAVHYSYIQKAVVPDHFLQVEIQESTRPSTSPFRQPSLPVQNLARHAVSAQRGVRRRVRSGRLFLPCGEGRHKGARPSPYRIRGQEISRVPERWLGYGQVRRVSLVPFPRAVSAFVLPLFQHIIRAKIGRTRKQRETAVSVEGWLVRLFGGAHERLSAAMPPGSRGGTSSSFPPEEPLLLVFSRILSYRFSTVFLIR